MLIFPSAATFAAVVLVVSLLLSFVILCHFSTTQLFREGIVLMHLVEPLVKTLPRQELVSNKILETIGGDYGLVASSTISGFLRKLNSTQWNVTDIGLATIGNITDYNFFGDIPFLDNLSSWDDVTSLGMGDFDNVMGIINSGWAVTTRTVVVEVVKFAGKFTFGSSLFGISISTSNLSAINNSFRST